MLTRTLLLAGIFSCTVNLLGAQQRWAPAIDSILAVKQIRAFNGVVLIAKDGKVQYEKSIGYADREKKRQLDMDSRFIIMSVTKQITAVMVLQEAEKGRIQLQQTLRTYLPDFPDRWADTITVHQLLNHTSGVVWYDQPLAFTPGSRYAYSNFGYALLKQVLEKVTGQPYRALASILFKKCGMSHSGVAGQLPAIQGYAYSEKVPGDILTPKDTIPDFLLAGAGVVSTAGDLLRWNQHLHGGKLLRDSSYQAMITAWQHRDHSILGRMGAGYGVLLTDDKKEIGHTGYMSQLGFTTINLYFPATRTSMIVLENVAWKESDLPHGFSFEKDILSLISPVAKENHR
ncbi:serine hydrolase domain-containing protein [Chitinophaga sp. Ak27]|uniref:serine hydrolase domain-containing protein n=1 Tax=Chitinophaga sp. Ak27 TaxID=2726116 RepID=UPI00145FB62D|nr:serine hydrolase domain-containing protein [Chitinophaga sp. Ak27]NLU93500.1 beta-lactamase family protein [Chitinophaga sp. Ak27]